MVADGVEASGDSRAPGRGHDTRKDFGSYRGFAQNMKHSLCGLIPDKKGRDRSCRHRWKVKMDRGTRAGACVTRVGLAGKTSGNREGLSAPGKEVVVFADPLAKAIFSSDIYDHTASVSLVCVAPLDHQPASLDSSYGAFEYGCGIFHRHQNHTNRNHIFSG